jgi:hypothetical protein
LLFPFTFKFPMLQYLNHNLCNLALYAERPDNQHRFGHVVNQTPLASGMSRVDHDREMREFLGERNNRQVQSIVVARARSRRK